MSTWPCSSHFRITTLNSAAPHRNEHRRLCPSLPHTAGAWTCSLQPLAASISPSGLISDRQSPEHRLKHCFFLAPGFLHPALPLHTSVPAVQIWVFLPPRLYSSCTSRKLCSVVRSICSPRAHNMQFYISFCRGEENQAVFSKNRAETSTLHRTPQM